MRHNRVIINGAFMITNKINADIILNELESGIRFGTDALLLADFASNAKKGLCIDLGTGSGVIPLLMLASGSNASFIGLELQPEYANIASENAKSNGYGDRFRIINGDAADYKSLFESGRADYVVTNPPYMRADCGAENASDALNVARREIAGGAFLQSGGLVSEKRRQLFRGLQTRQIGQSFHRDEKLQYRAKAAARGYPVGRQKTVAYPCRRAQGRTRGAYL